MTIVGKTVQTEISQEEETQKVNKHEKLLNFFNNEGNTNPDCNDAAHKTH